MSYTITVSIYRTNPSAFFRVVEQANFSSCTWDVKNDQYVLTMTGSGTSGSLRLNSEDDKESFIATFGVHNYKRWGDIVTGLAAKDTGVQILPQYYDSQHADRVQARERQLATYNVSSAQGRKFTINYTVADGNNLKADLIIG